MMSKIESCKNLVEALQMQAKKNSNKIAFIFLKDGLEEEQSITFEEIDHRARSIASVLQKNHQQGDTALLLYPQGIEHMCALWGCFYAGIYAVPLYLPQNNRAYQRIRSIQKDCNAKIVMSDTESYKRMHKRLDDMSEIEQLDWFLTDKIDIQNNTWQPTTLPTNSLAYLQYTSGSTGSPKGVMVSHNNLMYNLKDMSSSWEHSADSILVSWLPIFHDMGLIVGFLQGIYDGFKTVFYSPSAFAQRPYTWLKAITDYKATHTGGPNSAYIMCAEKTTDEQRAYIDLRSLKFMFNGSEPVRSDTLKMFTQAFADCGFKQKMHMPCYGLAEATLKVTTTKPDDVYFEWNVDASALESHKLIDAIDKQPHQTFISSGNTILDTTVKIVDPVSLIECSEDRVGEIWVKGPTVALGYLNKEADTREIFQAHISDTQEGPYLRTGDLGFLKNNHLFIAGRLKDLIIIRGRNCYPQDIEEIVAKSHEALIPNGGAAFSFEENNEEKLVIVQSVRRSHLKNIDSNSIFHSIRKAVSTEFAMKVHSIELLMPTALPKTTSGKIQRRACKKAYIDNKLDIIASWKISV